MQASRELTNKSFARQENIAEIVNMTWCLCSAFHSSENLVLIPMAALQQRPLDNERFIFLALFVFIALPGEFTMLIH